MESHPMIAIPKPQAQRSLCRHKIYMQHVTGYVIPFIEQVNVKEIESHFFDFDESGTPSETDALVFGILRGGGEIDPSFAKRDLRCSLLVGIFHFWERDIRSLLIRNLSSPAKTETEKIQKAPDCKLRDLPMSDDYERKSLDRAALLAKAIKHGEGRSFTELNNPDNAYQPVYQSSFSDLDKNETDFMRALSGPRPDLLSVSDDDFMSLDKSIQSFWNALPDKVSISDL